MVCDCALYGCLSTSKEKERSFFRFPKDERRCKLWITASGRTDLMNKTAKNLNASYYLCDLHFEASDRYVKKLRPYAIPSKNLPQNLPQDFLVQTRFTQTEYSIPEKKSTKEKAAQTSIPEIILRQEQASQTSISTMNSQALSAATPLKRNLLRQYTTECKRRKILEAQQNSTAALQKESDISPEFKKLIELHNKLKPNCRSNKYDKNYKLFALNIFYASPLAYRVLAKTLSLPSERSLRRIKIDIGTKLNPNVLNSLQLKLKCLDDSGKYCIICADEISIKRNLYYQINKDKIVGFHEIDGVQTAEPATQAYVIMARGIFSNWKQPLGYCFLAKSKYYAELKIWLNNIISKLLTIGLNVVAFVSDQDSIFLNLADERNVSADQPYFYVDETKIYNIFDVPHLINSMRNTLMKYDFEFLDQDGQKMSAKWEDIEEFYQQDCEKAYRLAPKLTQSHINPNNFEKMKVEYATQVFSGTVAAAMSCAIECNRLSKAAIGTVKLIELMDKTFDVLNSSSVKNSNKYKCAYASKPHQTEILDRFHYFLANVTVVSKENKDVTNSIKCFKCLKITLNGIQSLAKDLQSGGFNFLYTRRLNQDALEKKFGSVRHQGGIRREPTPVQFSRAFNKLYVMNLLNQSDRANCSDDLHKLLMCTDCVAMNIKSEEQNVTVEVGSTDYRFDIPEKNAFGYVCGYLLKKCLDIHKCERIVHYVSSNKVLLINDADVLINPPASFTACVKAMDERFKMTFQKKILDSVGNNILNELTDISVTDCCDCFPNMYLKKLFVRFRIYNVLRFNNRMFRDKSFKRKYFSVSNL